MLYIRTLHVFTFPPFTKITQIEENWENRILRCTNKTKVFPPLLHKVIAVNILVTFC